MAVVPYVFVAVILTINPDGSASKSRMAVTMADAETCVAYKRSIPDMPAVQKRIVRFEEVDCKPQSPLRIKDYVRQHRQ